MNPSFPIDPHTFDQCPQCQRSWGYNNFCSCGLQILGNTMIRRHVYDKGNLFWRLDIGMCLYSTGEMNISIPLPWLPYDITDDQLQLYLTFS